jgi:hypothetical protein
MDKTRMRNYKLLLFFPTKKFITCEAALSRRIKERLGARVKMRRIMPEDVHQDYFVRAVN